RGGKMEQSGRRRAFGSICPNTVQGPPARLVKKAARPGGGAGATPGGIPPDTLSPRAPTSRPRRSVPPPTPAAPAFGESSQALTMAMFPLLLQGTGFQDRPEFDFQEFRDALFPTDPSTLMPPPLDCTDFDFSLGEEGVFGSCNPQLKSSALAQMSPQHLPSPEPCWRYLAGQHQKALGDALEANSQLQKTLTQRQEELVTLQESNMQLKELASQARQLAAVLDTMMLPQCNDGAAAAAIHASPPPPAAAAPAGIWDGRGRLKPREEVAGVDAMLREVSEKCRAALRSLGASPGGSPGTSPTAKRPRPAPFLYGIFRGLRTVRAAPRPGGGVLEGDGSLRAALGEASGIRTLAFPQGSAFTLRTASGGYRFRWVPR
ncbi:MCIN protein, partial [Alcedo cyanopectus]|nr:MCIN protein [Ceyx cyanopectus]